MSYKSVASKKVVIIQIYLITRLIILRLVINFQLKKRTDKIKYLLTYILLTY